jgi:uncharacterized membrane protein
MGGRVSLGGGRGVDPLPLFVWIAALLISLATAASKYAMRASVNIGSGTTNLFREDFYVKMGE